MARVSSDTGAASAATSGFNHIEIGSKKDVQFSQSNISGMNAGKELANQILTDFEGLVSCVRTQAGKFNQLASVRESLDASDRQMFQ